MRAVRKTPAALPAMRHPHFGAIVNGGSGYLSQAWWIATLPGIAIVFTVSSFNLLGDALRDALDPRQPMSRGRVPRVAGRVRSD